MTRFLRIAVVTLVASLFLSVLVAWSCSVLVRPDDDLMIGLAIGDGKSWELARMSGPGLTLLASTRAKSTKASPPLPDLDQLGPGLSDQPERSLPAWGDIGTATAAFDDLPTTDETVFEYRTAVAAGWPFRCVWCEQHALVGTKDDLRRLPTTGFFRTSAVPLNGRPDIPRVLPLRPIPLGLAANTVLYAATMLACGFGASWLRRLVRRRRGCCEQCGYRCVAVGPCPECGHLRASRAPA